MSTSPPRRGKKSPPSKSLETDPDATARSPEWADANCRAVLEAAPDAMLVVNRGGEIVAANQEATKLYGCSREHLIGRVVESLIPARLCDRHRQHRENFFANPETQAIQVLEIFAVRSDASEIPVDVSLNLLTIGTETFAICAIRDTTARVRAEELKRSETILRESEERFRLVADTAPVLIWQSGPDKLCTYFNKPWLDFTGRSLEHELGNGWAEGVHPEDFQRCLDTYRQSFDRREKFRMEYRIRHRDGEYRWILDVGVPIFNADGFFAGYIGSGVDVTERKQAGEAVRASEERLRLAQQIARIGSFEWNIQTGVNTWTPELEAMYGLQPGTFTGTQTAFENLVHVDDRAGVIHLVDRALKTGQSTEGEWRVVWADGSIHWITGRWQVLMNESREPLRMIGVNIDVTDRKRAEEMHLEVNRTLEEQAALLQTREELLKIFVKHVPAGVAMLDREMRYLQVSERWCADYSVDASQVLGHSHYEIFPDIPQRWKEIHRRALEGETFRAEEDRWDRRGGFATWVRWEIRPWKTPSGDIGGILIFSEDISRRKQSEEALLEIPRRLIEAQEQERTRIGRELHDDIGQRLALLAVQLQQLHEDCLILPEVSTRLGELQKQISEIADDIQSLSHELLSAKLQYLGLAAAMRSFCIEFGEQQKVEIDFQSHDLPSPLSPDISLCLFRVLQEALHNSAKHSGVKHFEVRLWGTSDEIHVTVKDSGAGFEREAAKGSRGLGLITMEERVKLLKGTLSIESQPKRGTTIHARVPFDSSSDSAGAAG
jgi:PAS domain S-box-containing protein